MLYHSYRYACLKLNPNSGAIMRPIKKKLFFLFLFFSITSYANSSTLQVQKSKVVYLTQISYQLEVSSNLDTLQGYYLINLEHKIPVSFSANQKRGQFTSHALHFPEYGNWQLVAPNGEAEHRFWVVPGWTSILPPLIAILLALITRQVLIALFAGIFFGSFLINGFNPIAGFFASLTDYVAVSPADPDNMAIIVFSLALGGMVGVISKSGGTQGIVDRLSRYASDSRKGQLVTWLMGILIFFDDYANTLIVGNTMRPLTDRLKISREKLAYLVDSTAAPIATLAIVSTWIGYQLSLIDQSFKTVGISESAYLTFIQTIPYSFYPLFALVFGFFIAYTGRDFGFMLKAERRAKNEGKLLEDDATPLSELEDDLLAAEGTPLRWYNALVPVLTVIVTTLGGLWITGVQASGDLSNETNLLRYVSTVFGNANSFHVLIWGAFLGSIVAILLALFQKILSLNQAINAWIGGTRSMMIAALILTVAWAIGNICKDLQTANYVIYATSDLLSPHWIPTITFLIAGVIAFSTGTSWATMAILTPIVIPMALQLPSADVTISAGHASIIFLSSIAAILAGATFGDHCSPISDTTIMSSMASGADHIDHVRTQMPYALSVATISILFGFIPAGFGLGAGWTLILGFIGLFLIIRFVGKKI